MKTKAQIRRELEKAALLQKENERRDRSINAFLTAPKRSTNILRYIQDLYINNWSTTSVRQTKAAFSVVKSPMLPTRTPIGSTIEKLTLKVKAFNLFRSFKNSIKSNIVRYKAIRALHKYSIRDLIDIETNGLWEAGDNALRIKKYFTPEWRERFLNPYAESMKTPSYIKITPISREDYIKSYFNPHTKFPKK